MSLPTPAATSSFAVAPIPAGGNPAQDELGDLIYFISHDLRASLRALLEVPQWIEEDIYEMGHAIPPSLSENIAMMNNHTKRLDRMLCDLLVYSRVGRMQTKTAVNVNSILDEVIETLTLPASFVVERDLAWTSVTFGERDIVTMLNALIGNAIKHHDCDSGKIAVKTVWEGQMPVMYITDDGPGIQEKFADIIFDIMQTLRPRDEVEGSGIGLPIARRALEFHDGSVALYQPDNDRGACFRLQFANSTAA